MSVGNADYTKKLCPLLSAQMMRPPDTKLLVPGAKQQVESKGVPCQGPACAFYLAVNEPDSDGKVKQGGQCALALLPFSISMLGNQLCQTAALLSGASTESHEDKKGS